MRARVKKKQLYRRVTIAVVIAAILALLIGGLYYALVTSNALHRYDNEPVTTADIATLKGLSAPPYGPPGASMLASVKIYNGTLWTADGRPLLVYVGAEFCQYCAAQRWSIVLALMRFGNFTGLEYMSSSPVEGDLPTFTFQNSTYSSKYFVFQPFEQENRNEQPLQTVPPNYTSVFSSYGSAYPFLDFGNRYVIAQALYEPTLLEGENWTSVYTAIGTNSSLGGQIRAGANIITALVCKLTGNQPSRVCQQPPITAIALELTTYLPNPSGSISLMAVPAFPIPGLGSSTMGEEHK